MKREAMIWLLVLAFAVTGMAGCARKPAYSEMDPGRASGNQNQNQNQSAEGQANATAPAEARQAAPDAPQSAPAPPATIKNPTFLDPVTGGIKDLPSYPNAFRLNLQVGAIQGINTMSLAFSTTDSMDKIASHFDRVIKANNWTVEDRVNDSEFSQWTLRKGEDHNAKVQVKKNEQTKVLNIIMVRGEKIDTSGK